MDARAPTPDAKVAPCSLQLARWKPVCPTEQEGDSAAAELGGGRAFLSGLGKSVSLPRAESFRKFAPSVWTERPGFV